MNVAEAAKYCKRSADQGNSNAQNNYGTCLSQGMGVPVNPTEAVKYFKLAADQGDANAQNNYGTYVVQSVGISANEIEAAQYFKWRRIKDIRMGSSITVSAWSLVPESQRMSH
jgi:TPR repeat protein